MTLATPAQIAPGGNITSVVQATQAYGWPHVPQPQEMRDVAALTLDEMWVAPAHTAVRCYFGHYLGRVKCGVSIKLPHYRTSFRVDVRVYEDGSYRFL